MLPSNVSDFEATSPSPEKKGNRRGGGLVVMLALLVVLIAVIAVAVSRLPTGALSRPSAATVVPNQAAARTPAAAQTPAAAGAPADPATQRAIQQVIQQLDEAQAQAIATNNPNLMAPTATNEFYQEEVAANQDLVDNGVTEVKLINIEWGDIVVNGSSATATDWETWSTTFEDGTTTQSRDRNVYQLVQQDGAWKVQADDHPDQPQPQQPQQPGGAGARR